MSQEILYCISCSAYTMEQKCPKCSKPTITKKPEKYSTDDKYGEYRRKAKKKEREQEGLI